MKLNRPLFAIGLVLAFAFFGSLFQNCGRISESGSGSLQSSSFPSTPTMSPTPSPTAGATPTPTATATPTPTPPYVLQNRWQAVATAPFSLFASRAVWVGTKMFAFGGCEYNTVPCSKGGGLYDPVANTWQTINLATAPAGRQFHSLTVINNSKVLVFGGGSGSGLGSLPGGVPLGDGAIFDPATGTWQAIATAGAPSGRNLHTAVWTGTEVIIFGGIDTALNPFGNGAIYNPATNTWRPLATAGAPSARGQASAAWTGSKMIVFGGNNVSTLFNDGALFDPVTNTWTPMSTTNAPFGGFSHRSVWVGGKFYVFGGCSVGSATCDGTLKSYNPVTNTWTTLSTVGSPAGRGHLSMAVVDSKIVVFAGYALSTLFNNGAIYDIATNSWSAMAASPLTGRYGAEAVSTGSGVVFFSSWSQKSDGSYFR